MMNSRRRCPWGRRGWFNSILKYPCWFELALIFAAFRGVIKNKKYLTIVDPVMLSVVGADVMVAEFELGPAPAIVMIDTGI